MSATSTQEAKAASAAVAAYRDRVLEAIKAEIERYENKAEHAEDEIDGSLSDVIDATANKEVCEAILAIIDRLPLEGGNLG